MNVFWIPSLENLFIPDIKSGGFSVFHLLKNLLHSHRNSNQFCTPKFQNSFLSIRTIDAFSVILIVYTLKSRWVVVYPSWVSNVSVSFYIRIFVDCYNALYNMPHSKSVFQFECPPSSTCIDLSIVTLDKHLTCFTGVATFLRSLTLGLKKYVFGCGKIIEWPRPVWNVVDWCHFSLAPKICWRSTFSSTYVPFQSHVQCFSCETQALVNSWLDMQFGGIFFVFRRF